MSELDLDGTNGSTRRYQRAARYRSIVDRFETVARANLETIGHIKDICRVAGLNPRTLSRAFNATYGTTPHHHLRTIRLARARKALLSVDSPNASVTETALRFGFRELGRFAIEYRAAFGESPSETLARTLAGPRNAGLRAKSIRRRLKR